MRCAAAQFSEIKEFKIMKNKIIVSVLLIFALLVAAGCSDNGNNDATTDADTNIAETLPVTTAAPTTTEPPADDSTVRPLPVSFDINNPVNGTFSACFGGSDVVVDESKNVTVTFEVFVYDTYDPEKINKLKKGDTVIVDGKVVKVENVKEIFSGGVEINSKDGEKGICFVPEESGVYYIDTFTERKDTRMVGEITLPVSKDFVYINAENPFKGEVTSTLQEILDGKAKFKYDFESYNTTVTVKNGEIVSLYKV